MSGLTFTATKKAPARLVHENGDPYQLALTCRAEIETLTAEIIERSPRLVEIRRRRENGAVWFEHHGADHPRAQRNERLLNRLRDETSMLAWQIRDRKVQRTHAALGFWAAYESLSSIEQQAFGDVSGIERPDPDTYWHRMNDWGDR